jgi:hypothetical protein
LPALEDQVGADRHDSWTVGEGIHGDPLKVFHVAGGNVDEVVVGPGDKVDSAGVRLGKGVLDELADQWAVVRSGPDGEEGLQGEAEGSRVQPHGIAADDAGTAEPADPVQAGGGGDPGGGGEVTVGGPGVVLQDSQDLKINRIKFNCIGHLSNVTRNISWLAARPPMLEASDRVD